MEFWAEIWRKMWTWRVLLSTGMGKQNRKRRQIASLKSSSSVSDSSFVDKSGDLVAKNVSKKQRTTDQTVSTPISWKQNWSQFELLPCSTSYINRMDRGSNPTDGSSATSVKVFSPVDSQLGCHASHLGSQANKGVTNEDLMLKLYANSSEISKLSQ